MLVLYSHPVSQHCRRILALIDEAGITMDIRHVALEAGAHVSPDYLAINPKHQAPTLIDGDVKIHESNAILRYLADKHGLTDWYPAEPGARAAVDQWLDSGQCRIGPAAIDVVFHTVFAGASADTDAIARGHAQLADVLPVLDAALEDRAFLTGAVPTIADLTVASIVTHLALADAAPEHANISAWIKRVCRIPGFARTLPMATAAA